jgi:hypothetical protein
MSARHDHTRAALVAMERDLRKVLADKRQSREAAHAALSDGLVKMPNAHRPLFTQALLLVVCGLTALEGEGGDAPT